MYRKFLFFTIVILSLALTGCTSTGRQATKYEGDGALKGSLASEVCQKAWDYHQKNGQWPDAIYLAKHTGLSVHNRMYETAFGIYILERPYDPLPKQMDPTQTFAVSYYFDQADTSRYVQCKIDYSDGKGSFSSSTGEGDGASIWSMQMTAQKFMIDFFDAAQEANCASEFDKIVTKYSSQISEISPNPTAKQALFEYSYSLLSEYYFEVVNLSPAGDDFSAVFDSCSLRLGEFIFRQDWRH